MAIVVPSGGSLYVDQPTGFDTTGNPIYGTDLFAASGAETAMPGVFTVTDATVESGGFADIVGPMGSSVGMVVQSGGQMEVDGGNASDTILQGGSFYVAYGGTADATQVDAGSTFDVGASAPYPGDGTATNSVVNADGNMEILSGSTATGTTINGGTLALDAGGSLGAGSVTFEGTGGKLLIGGNTIPSNVISGFGAGDTIDLTGVPYTSFSQSATFFENNNTLQVVEGGKTYTFQLDQTVSGGFTLSPYSVGGTSILATPTAVDGYSTTVSPNSTAPSPYSGVVYISDSLGTGTGFLIGPNSILTAAHVVEGSTGLAKNIEVSFSSASGAPQYAATSVYVNPSYDAALTDPASASNEQNDFAVINVYNLPSGPAVFKLQSDFFGGTVNLTGYAAGLPQENDIGTVTPGSYFLLDYGPGLVSIGGDSGGPLWTYDGTSATAVGVVATNGYGVQLTPQDIANINSWTASIFSSPIVENTTGSEQILLASAPNSIVDGGGYDTLSLSHNPLATASSAYTETSNYNGTFTLSTKGSSDLVSGVMQVQFSDKTVTIAGNGSENEFIALLYQGALGRTPDAAGLAGWEQIGAALPSTATQSLGLAYALSDTSGGYNGSLSIAAGFTQSAEFIAKYGTLTPTQFVTQLYANILDRAPDPAGLAGWLAQLSAGASQAHVLVGFADSAEAINNATLGYTGQSGTHASWLFLT